MRFRFAVTLLVGAGLACAGLTPAGPASPTVAAHSAASAPNAERVVSLGPVADGVTVRADSSPTAKAKAKAKARTRARARARARAKAKARARAKARAKATASASTPVPPIATPVTPATPTAPPTAASTDYALMHFGPAGKTARWNPCQPVGWRLNPLHAPDSAVADVTTALQRVSARTGLSFAYEGATDDRPFTGTAHPAGEDLLLGYGTPAEYPANLAGDVIGLGGPSVRYSISGGVESAYEIVSGEVLFSTAANLPAGFSTGLSFGTLAMHEIAHAMGLDHAAGPGEVMAASLSASSPNDYAAGDQAGLALVGSSGGCFVHSLR
jgi:Matrixin